MFGLPASSSARVRWPLVVLLLSIALTAVAVVDAQRAVRSQQRVAERALREYASFAAWSYSRHLTEMMLLMSREAIGAVNHGDALHTGAQVPHATDLAAYLPWDASCPCHRTRTGPRPTTFFAMQVGKPAIEVGRADHERMLPRASDDRATTAMTAALDVPRDYAPAEGRWIVDSLTRRVRGERDRGYSYVVASRGDARYLLSYTLMPTAWGDTMVYGARYDSAAFARLFGDVLDANGLLPRTFTEGRRNRDVLAVRVADAAGRPLFDSAPGVTSPLNAHLDLPGRVGALALDVVIRPEVAGTLLIGGLPRSRLPFLLGLLALAAALSIVAVAQLRREGELARVRADFVSSVSHELRTPLAQIRLYVETMRLGRAASEADRAWALERVDRETTRLTHLVDKVLRFSTAGRGLSAAPERVDAAAAVSQIVEEFRPLALSRRATIALATAPAPPVTVAADGLRHIVLNLLDNAVKYGPPGQTVRVDVAPVGGEVRIAVADEGSGVPAREREAIWLPFRRGAAAGAEGGSGIGLTVVRSTVEQAGGRAWVESAEGGGARFVVALPVA